MGFKNIIISDDLGIMKSVTDHYSTKEWTKLGFAAGIDILLANASPEIILESYESLIYEIEQENLKQTDIKTSLDNILRIKKKISLPKQFNLNDIGQAENQELMKQVQKYL